MLHLGPVGVCALPRRDTHQYHNHVVDMARWVNLQLAAILCLDVLLLTFTASRTHGHADTVRSTSW